MRNKLQQFMIGRNGLDSYGRFLLVASASFILLGFLTYDVLTSINLFGLVGIMLLIYGYYRMFSRNTNRRMQENRVYYGIKNEVITQIQRHIKTFSLLCTHKVFKCPQCKQGLRVPRKRGKIVITCSKCKKEFQKRT